MANPLGLLNFGDDLGAGTFFQMPPRAAGGEGMVQFIFEFNEFGGKRELPQRALGKRQKPESAGTLPFWFPGGS